MSRGVSPDRSSPGFPCHVEQHTARRLAAIVHASADAIIGETIDGIITDWNPAAERLYGYSADEIIGKHRSFLIPPEGLEAVESRVHRLKHGERIQGVEVVRWTKDGRRIDVSLSIAPVWDDAGELVATCVISRDITERKITEAELAASSELFRVAFTNAPIAMVLADRNVSVLQVNEALCRMLGYSDHELLRGNLWHVTHPDDLQENQNAIARALAGEADTYDLEKRYIHRDGHIVWGHLRGSLVRDTDGAPLYFVSQIEDITERKEADAALAASEDRFRAAFEEAPFGMAIVRPDQSIVRVNRATCATLGYSELELLGRTMLAITYPADRTENADLMARALAGEFTRFEMENRYIRKDGEIVHTLLSVTLLRNQDGSPRYFLSQIQDITARKMAEAEFTATHHHTRQVLERITDGFYALDRDWRFTYVNPAAEQMLGYAGGSLLGQNVWDAFPPAVDTPLFAVFSQVMRDGRATTIENYYPPFGAWYEVQLYPSRDGLSVFFRDVTESRRLIEALRNSETRFRTLVEQLPAVVYLLAADETQTPLYFSPRYEALTGFDRDSALVTTSHWLIKVHPDDRAQVASALAQAEEQRLPFVMNYRYVRQDGNAIWVEDRCDAIRDEFGAVVAWLGTMQDVTERIEAEVARGRLAAIVDSAEDAVISRTLDGSIASWNAAAERLYGYSAEDIIGQPISRLFSKSDPSARMVTIEEFAEQPIRLESIHLRKSGEPFTASISLSPILDRRGSITGVASITRDVSARKLAEEALQAALDEAHAGIRAKSLFLAMMSHEMRTPLQAVLGYAHLLIHGELNTLTAEQQEDIGAIQQNAERLVNMIDQLLTLTRLESGQLPLESAPVDLSAIVAQVREEMSPRLKAKGLLFVARVPKDLPPILGDATRVRQILLNLFDNAIKFTDSGTISLRASATNREIAIVVRDTGIGISPDVLPVVFDEFRQGDSSLTRRYGGAGLGLAMSQRLATQMRGRLMVESILGKGSTFTLQLPMIPEARGRRGHQIRTWTTASSPSAPST